MSQIYVIGFLLVMCTVIYTPMKLALNPNCQCIFYSLQRSFQVPSHCTAVWFYIEYVLVANVIVVVWWLRKPQNNDVFVLIDLTLNKKLILSVVARILSCEPICFLYFMFFTLFSHFLLNHDLIMFEFSFIFVSNPLNMQS